MTGSAESSARSAPSSPFNLRNSIMSSSIAKSRVSRVRCPPVCSVGTGAESAIFYSYFKIDLRSILCYYVVL